MRPGKGRSTLSSLLLASLLSQMIAPGIAVAVSDRSSGAGKKDSSDKKGKGKETDKTEDEKKSKPNAGHGEGGTEKEGGDHTDADNPVNEYSSREFETFGGKAKGVAKDRLENNKQSAPNREARSQRTEGEIDGRKVERTMTEKLDKNGKTEGFVVADRFSDGQQTVHTFDRKGNIVSSDGIGRGKGGNAGVSELTRTDPSGGKTAGGPSGDKKSSAEQAKSHDDMDKAAENARNDAEKNVSSLEAHISGALPEKEDENNEKRNELEHEARVARERISHAAAAHAAAESEREKAKQNAHDKAIETTAEVKPPSEADSPPPPQPEQPQADADKSHGQAMADAAQTSAQEQSSNTTSSNAAANAKKSSGAAAAASALSKAAKNLAKYANSFVHAFNPVAEEATPSDDGDTAIPPQPDRDIYNSDRHVSNQQANRQKSLKGFKNAKQVKKADRVKVKSILPRASNRAADKLADAMNKGDISSEALNELKNSIDLTPEFTDNIIDEFADQAAEDNTVPTASSRDVAPAKGDKEITDRARTYLAKDLAYQSPPKDPDTTDCSHLVHEIFKSLGNHYSFKGSQAFATAKQAPDFNFSRVPEGEAQPGDVVVFLGSEESQSNHMGIVVAVGEDGTISKVLSATTRSGNAKEQKRGSTDYQTSPNINPPTDFNKYGRWHTFRWRGP